MNNMLHTSVNGEQYESFIYVSGRKNGRNMPATISISVKKNNKKYLAILEFCVDKWNYIPNQDMVNLLNVHDTVMDSKGVFNQDIQNKLNYLWKKYKRIGKTDLRIAGSNDTIKVSTWTKF